MVTCVEFLWFVLQIQQIIDHGGLAYAPGPQKQHHGFGGNLSI